MVTSTLKIPAGNCRESSKCKEGVPFYNSSLAGAFSIFLVRYSAVKDLLYKDLRTNLYGVDQAPSSAVTDST